MAPQTEKKLKGTKVWWHPIAAGGLAGIVSRCCVAPLDVAKIKLQTQLLTFNPSNNSWAGQTPPKHQHRHTPGYTRILQTLQSVYRAEGVPGLWRGNVPAMALYSTYSGLQFMFMKRAKADLFNGRRGHVVSFCSGALAGSAATVLTYPLDLLRTQMAASAGCGARATVRSTISRAMGRGLLDGAYSGIGPALLMLTPYMGCTFMFYDALTAHFLHIDVGAPAGSGSQTLGTCKAAAIGGFAGLAAKLVVFPLDTLKKRMQVRGLVADPVSKELPTAWTIVRGIALTEGARGFYRGATAASLKVAPATGITFAVYEWCSKWLQPP